MSLYVKTNCLTCEKYHTGCVVVPSGPPPTGDPLKQIVVQIVCQKVEPALTSIFKMSWDDYRSLPPCPACSQEEEAGVTFWIDEWAGFLERWRIRKEPEAHALVDYLSPAWLAVPELATPFFRHKASLILKLDGFHLATFRRHFVKMKLDLVLLCRQPGRTTTIGSAVYRSDRTRLVLEELRQMLKLPPDSKYWSSIESKALAVASELLLRRE